jgi:hypothetical protein
MIDKPTCAVRGVMQGSTGRVLGMCRHIVVGGKQCGFAGECEHQRKPEPAASGVIVVGEAQQPGETYLAYLARCEREGRNTKPQAKDPDLCREPGCSNPTKTPVSAWCREHDRAGGAPHA